MIKNYFKIAFRNLWKHRAFSFINIMGLTVGMTACFLIFLYVRFELSYDRFHDKADRIYRVVADIKTPTELIHSGVPAWAVPPHLGADFPEVESYVRVMTQPLLVRKGEMKFQEDDLAMADSAFFHIFSFPMLHGDPKTALNDPFTMVLSQTAAKKYFGSADPIGQTLLLSGQAFPVKITGVMADIPENSLIKGDMIVSMATISRKLNPGIDEQWSNYGPAGYVLLKPGVNAKALEAKLPGFIQRRDGDNEKKSQMFATLFLEPLKSIYLHSTRGNGFDKTSGSISNVYIFSIVAVFILLIACINFINLTTARSVERAKEVGIRKVVGALRQQLARQFIGESVLLCLISFVIVLGLAVLLRGPFNDLAGKTISKGIFENGYYILGLGLAAVLIGLLAGIYPALVLSSFRPVVVLKGRFATGTKGILLRKGLVVTQFTISIAFIIATFIVNDQLKFMRSQDLGFSKDQVMVFNTDGDPARDAFRQAVAALPGVRMTAMSSSVPGGGNPAAYSEIQNKKGDLQVANLDLYFVDWDYIGLFKIKMVAGRGFDRSFQSDTTHAMILNQAAVKMFGYASPEQAVGRRFKQWGREGTIIGVMKDFHYHGLQTEIKPLSMRIEPQGTQLVCVNVSPANLPKTIAAIGDKWKTLIPNKPFSYYFVDESFDKQYRGEERFGKLFLNFAVLAIFISCLGLLGLASYSTIQRTKEIGIRKVMGASVTNIVNLLSRDFLILVLVSFLIAAPVAWWFMHNWLKDFAYRITIHPWVFLLACGMALVIAMATISFQAIRSAVANPVKSLRSE
jgi:putative ABC transport system permease protein